MYGPAGAGPVAGYSVTETSEIYQIADPAPGTWKVELLGVEVAEGGEEVQLATLVTGRDLDGDGCTDTQELGPDQSLGGLRDPLSFWDFFDVWTGQPPIRDRQVFGQDIDAIVRHSGNHDLGSGPFDRNSDPRSYRLTLSQATIGRTTILRTIGRPSAPTPGT